MYQKLGIKWLCQKLVTVNAIVSIKKKAEKKRDYNVLRMRQFLFVLMIFNLIFFYVKVVTFYFKKCRVVC